MYLEADIQPANGPVDSPPVPAELLFPGWRGREPLAGRLELAGNQLREANAALGEAVAAVPFAAFEAAHGARQPVFRYNVLPQAAADLLAKLPDGIRPAWLCALLVWHMEQFDARFAASGLHGEFALHYTDCFHRIVDQIEQNPAFADAASDSFLKDMWLTRVVMIPAFAQLWWPHAGLSLRPLLAAGPVRAAQVIAGCGGRRPMLEGHTHDPMAKAYWNEQGWGQALRLAALALPALPEARGVFGSAWFYDPVILEISPRVGFAQQLQIGKGAWHVCAGSNEDAIANATATSPTRREMYAEGSYLPTDWMAIWSRRNLLRAYG